VSQFPDSVERLEGIDAVERFLRRHVSVSG